jgi:hypothetical protein
MNRLDMTEREVILALLRRHWSLRRIERETGHRRETIARYGREARLLPAKPAKVPTDSKCTTSGEVPTDLGATRSSAEPFRAFIEASADT